MSDTMNDLLDETLDDLADLPVSSPFTPGAHVADMTIQRDQKKSWMYIVKFKHKTTLELADPSKTPPNPGDEATMFIHTKKKDGKEVNEFGQGQLKMILMPLAERLGTTSVSALVEATKPGIEVAITSGIRKQDGYPDAMQLMKIMLT